MSDLHNQSLVTTIDVNDRLSAGVPGQSGCKNIKYSDFITQIASDVTSEQDFLDIINNISIAVASGANLLFASLTDRDAYSANSGDKCFVVSEESLYEYTTSWALTASIGDIQSAKVTLRQSPDIPSVNNLDLGVYQSFAFTDNVNNLQLINASGLSGGEHISIRFYSGQTCEHDVSISGDYEPLYLANKADSTFTSDFRILFEYKKNQQRFEEIGRVSEAVAQQFIAAFAQGNAYNSLAGLTIKGLSANLLSQVVTLENQGTGSKTISGDEILIGAGSCFGVIGRDIDGNKLFEIPCCEGNADKTEVVEIINSWVLTIEGAKTVVKQDKYFPPIDFGFTLLENTSDSNDYMIICYNNIKNNIY